MVREEKHMKTGTQVLACDLRFAGKEEAIFAQPRSVSSFLVAARLNGSRVWSR
jgi:hypothetical protein